MRFYRVHVYDDADGSRGYQWFTRKREAEQVVRAESMPVKRPDLDDGTPDATPDQTPLQVEPIDIEPTRAGILKALRIYASHPNNG